jgi:hypothetical protein
MGKTGLLYKYVDHKCRLRPLRARARTRPLAPTHAHTRRWSADMQLPPSPSQTVWLSVIGFGKCHDINMLFFRRILIDIDIARKCHVNFLGSGRPFIADER